MKRGLLITGVAFSVTLGIIFGFRVSADALAVIIGVILGVVASVPTTALVMYILTRPRPGSDGDSPKLNSYQPPVVVINTADKSGMPYPSLLPAPDPATQGRKWTVIGDTDTET